MLKIRQMPTAKGKKILGQKGGEFAAIPDYIVSLKHLLSSSFKEKKSPSPWLHTKIEVTCKANEFSRAQLKMVNNNKKNNS